MALNPVPFRNWLGSVKRLPANMIDRYADRVDAYFEATAGGQDQQAAAAYVEGLDGTSRLELITAWTCWRSYLQNQRMAADWRPVPTPSGEPYTAFEDWLCINGSTPATARQYGAAVTSARLRSDDGRDELALVHYHQDAGAATARVLATAWPRYRAYCSDVFGVQLPSLRGAQEDLPQDLALLAGQLRELVGVRVLGSLRWGAVDEDQGLIADPNRPGYALPTYKDEERQLIREALAAARAWGRPAAADAPVFPLAPGSPFARSAGQLAADVRQARRGLRLTPAGWAVGPAGGTEPLRLPPKADRAGNRTVYLGPAKGAVGADGEAGDSRGAGGGEPARRAIQAVAPEVAGARRATLAAAGGGDEGDGGMLDDDPDGRFGNEP